MAHEDLTAHQDPAAGDDDRGREWRRYWCLVLPVVTSWYLTLALALLLLARGIGGGGGGAVGGALAWWAVTAYRCRPGAEHQPDRRFGGRRHAAGVVVVQRPTAARAPEPPASPTAAPGPRETTARAARDDARDAGTTLAWAGFVLALDVVVVVVLLTARVWPGWVTVPALALLVTHGWFLRRVLRARRRDHPPGTAPRGEGP